MQAQTRQVFENLRAILAANGATFADVVKIGTYLTTLDDLAGMREVRSEYLTSEPPASTAVQVVALVVPEALIEIDLVAVVPA
jgi:enamine deaminase RidA (YjgF/YER057c/UK114 family)